MTSKTYAFAENDPKDLVAKLLTRYQQISYFVLNRGIMGRWVKSFNSYYGFYYVDQKTAYGIGTGGQQGELTNVAINQYRNLIQHTLALTTQNKVSFDAIPINSDIEGRNASMVANATLEYYLEQPKYAQTIYQWAELGVVFGTSFLKVYWDTDKQLSGVDGDLTPVYRGEANLKTFSPLDVIVEPFKSSFGDQTWVCTREVQNRFDLATKYPDQLEDIMALDRISDLQLADPYFSTDEDHVWVYMLYHKSTPAMPFGRHTIFSSADVVYEDYRESPYCDTDPETGFPITGSGIPIVCFRPAVTYGSAWGHTVGFDLLPLQDMKNMLASTIATNQAAFGVQNIIVPRGTNANFADIANGMRVVEIDFNADLGPSGGAPAILELLKTPSEIFDYNNKIDEEMEKISGINGALRGTPPPQVSSGTAMALLTTQAQTFNTQLENVYIAGLQDIATLLIRTIAKFMPDKDLVNLVGLKEDYAIASFRGEELSKIQKIKILTGNAMSKSPAGRLAIAQDMLNSGQITPSDYTEVVETGYLKDKMEDITAEDALIQWENQQLIQGKPVEALLTDNPLTHMKGHRATLLHPDVRGDIAKQQNVMKHLADHQQNWVILGVQNPQLLALITGSPIPPDVPQQGVTPGAQGAPPGQAPPNNAQQVKKPTISGPQPGKNNLTNASTPGGVNDLAASANRSAQKLMTVGRK